MSKLQTILYHNIMKRYYIVFTGRVQNVGFRNTVKMLADKLNLSGWVRNMANGNVEMEIEGNEENIALLLRKMQTRVSWIKITDYAQKEIALKHDNNFLII